MNPRELRIGNLVMDGLTKEPLMVSELTEQNAGAYVINRDKYPLPDGWIMEGMPITEEWLLKLGFKPYPTKSPYWKHYITDNDFTVSFAIQDNDMYKNGEIICSHEETQLQYIHQVQNLYFFLCGCKAELNLIK